MRSVTSSRDTLDSDDYDEFGLLHENAAEWDIPFTGQPVVSRRSFTLPSGQALSYLRWGEGEPELVFLHGAAQNGHTWDTVMLALGRPAVAVDLPGHGHSDRRSDRDYGPWRNAEAVAALMEDGRAHRLLRHRHVARRGHDDPPGRATTGPVPPPRLRRRDAPDQRSVPPPRYGRARHRLAHRRASRLRQLRRDGRRRRRPEPLPVRGRCPTRGAPQRAPPRRRPLDLALRPLRSRTEPVGGGGHAPVGRLHPAVGRRQPHHGAGPASYAAARPPSCTTRTSRRCNDASPRWTWSWSTGPVMPCRVTAHSCWPTTSVSSPCDGPSSGRRTRS